MNNKQTNKHYKFEFNKKKTKRAIKCAHMFKLYYLLIFTAVVAVAFIERPLS